MFIDKHISSIVKSCFLQLHDFCYIRPFISKIAVITLANASVHSHLDFCNSLFYGLPKFSIHRLQKVLNTVARIVTNSSRFLHITPTLKSLHWLPIFYRINFKICCIIYHALSLGEPFSAPLENHGQKVKKTLRRITKIRWRRCKIHGIFMYFNLHKNMHKNTCFMPIFLAIIK